MKLNRILIAILLLGCCLAVKAQTVDDIIDNYFENTGGVENWKQLQGFKFTAKLSTQGFELPLDVVQLKDGRQVSVASFQGQEIKQGVWDGEILWSTNFMTMQAEESDSESTENFKLNLNDFPDPLLGYKEKGYTLEFLGKETIEGTETFKLKLVKEPQTIDGKQIDDVSYYYFETENFVPIAVESQVVMGPAAGMTQQTLLSDYQEVDGLYFPFSTTIAMKGQPGQQTISVQSMELNPEVDDAIFKKPEE